jgi:hypothetical protein
VAASSRRFVGITKTVGTSGGDGSVTSVCLVNGFPTDAT